MICISLQLFLFYFFLGLPYFNSALKKPTFGNKIPWISYDNGVGTSGFLEDLAAMGFYVYVY